MAPGSAVKLVLRWLAVMLLTVAVASCTYEGPDGSWRTPSPEPSLASFTSRPPPTREPGIMAVEKTNYATLRRFLNAAEGKVILEDSGPLDGPARGFGKTAMVETAGIYTVTAACVGAAEARLFLVQDNPQTGFKTVELSVGCSRASSKTIQLQQGHISAHALLPSPGDTRWTGAVAGVRVTARG